MTTVSRSIERGLKTSATTGFLVAISAAAINPAFGMSVITNATSIASTAVFNSSTSLYNYTYTFSYTSQDSDSYRIGASFSIPVFNQNAITNIAVPQNWTGSVNTVSAWTWDNIYSPAADANAGTYEAAATAFAAKQVPYILYFSGDIGTGTTANISGFSFSSTFAPSAAPYVARISSESNVGEITLIGKTVVPASTNFPVPEPTSSALLLAAGALFAARRNRL